MEHPWRPTFSDTVLIGSVQGPIGDPVGLWLEAAELFL